MHRKAGIKEQHPEKTGAGSTDDHLIQHHIGHDHAATEGRKAVMHGIDGAVR
jgi:hypothetical protein